MDTELTWAPAWRIVELVRAREVSPVAVLEHFLARIEEHEPVLQAFEHLDLPRARAEAKAAETAVLAGDELGELHGVPTAVKSHIDIAGVPETLPFGTGIARLDHPVIERLRAAGAIVIGHTRMPVVTGDFSYDYAASARNPWDTTRSSGISSAGTAAAVAGGLLPIAVGSDGGGSSRLPAAYSGYIGVHPTAGLVPWVNPRGQTFNNTSTIGPATRDVRDAATMLAVIGGPDPRDQEGLHVALADPRSQLHLGADGLRLAWTDDFGFALDYAVEESPRVIAQVRESAFASVGTGATIEAITEPFENYVDAFRVYSYAGVASLGLPGIGHATDEEWDAAAAVRSRLWARFEALFTQYDLLLTPTIHSVAPTPEQFTERVPSGMSLLQMTPGTTSFVAYTALFNWLRFPAVSVPCGFVDGLPVGLQIVGPPGSEARIFRFAQAFVDAFPQPSRPPAFA